jgi:hypothetical protein
MYWLFGAIYRLILGGCVCVCVYIYIYIYILQYHKRRDLFQIINILRIQFHAPHVEARMNTAIHS